MSMNGVDIASYQGDMDITKTDADFVIIKITQSDYYVNPFFENQFKTAKNCGKLVGMYHYSNGLPVETECEYFLKNAKNYIGQAIICFDWESNGSTKVHGYNPVFGKANEVEYCRKWAEIIHTKTGIWPFMYMSASVTRRKDWSSVAKNCPLWVAQYKNYNVTGWQEKPWTDNKGCGAWKKFLIHQYSPSGSIPGYEQHNQHKLDLDIAYMSKEDWMKLQTGEFIPYKEVTPQLIADILSNKYGTGDARRKKLINEGYDYKEVQATINLVLDLESNATGLKNTAGKYWDLVLKRAHISK